MQKGSLEWLLPCRSSRDYKKDSRNQGIVRFCDAVQHKIRGGVRISTGSLAVRQLQVKGRTVVKRDRMQNQNWASVWTTSLFSDSLLQA